MKAKQAIAETRVINEAPGDPSSEPPGGSTGGTAGSRMPVRKRPQPGQMSDEDEMPPAFMSGGPGMRPPGGGNQTGLLKDVLLLMCTELLGNDFDGPIARKLIDGKPLDPPDIAHILDEAPRIQNLPEAHQKLLKKLATEAGR